VLGDEIQNGAIERLGLLPIDRVPGFRHHHQFAIRDPGGGGVDKSATPEMTSVGASRSASRASVIRLAGFWREPSPT
jgi:hypothetical protein